MADGDISIEVPESERQRLEFVGLHDRVYAARPIRWPALVAFHLAVLRGHGPFVSGRTLRPYIARVGDTVVARALAVLDHRYHQRWNEPVGHLNMFEAQPGSGRAVRRLLDTACQWLADAGMRAARAGYGMLEFPFVIDAYDALPPSILRQNPPYYHALLKDAGFETEQGWVDYRIEVRPELVAHWENALTAASRAGFEIVPLRDVAAADRARLFANTWNEAFEAHWGQTPFTEDEIDVLFRGAGAAAVLDTSVLAFAAGEPVGVLWVAPENTAAARCRPGRAVRDDERLNFLGIGVRRPARGQGINLAMASYAYLGLVRAGATHLSYTLVLDDNWPSRRTAERLGGVVCANYLTYRRRLDR
jgi:hypothetical protein